MHPFINIHDIEIDSIDIDIYTINSFHIMVPILLLHEHNMHMSVQQDDSYFHEIHFLYI